MSAHDNCVMFYKLLILCLFGAKYSKALKCYSCGEENTFLGQENLNPLPCEDMEKNENLENFIIECPEEYLGCVTQFSGKDIKRTCDTPAVDDCETANGITYCYCSQNLCNGKQSRIDAHKSLRDINYPSDDEDYMDMSGHRHPDDIDDTDDANYDEKNFILNNSINFKKNFNKFFIFYYQIFNILIILYLRNNF